MSKKLAVFVAASLLFAAVIVVKLVLFLVDFLQPYRLPPGDWAIYQKNFISPEGRVIDTGNQNVSHSEGQGYGLLIAEAYKDRKAFDRIWEWTQKNLQTRPNDKLLSWLWKPGEKEGGAVADPNNASDGDLLVAWALVRAFNTWQDYRYQQAAAQILTDLAKFDIKQAEGGPYLLPGTDGFAEEETLTLNPSYYVFPAFAEIETAFPGGPWRDLSKSGLAFLEKARFGKWKLAPDWAAVEGTQVSLSPKFPPVFGYNAVRVPLHLAWHDVRSPQLASYADFWKTFAPEKIPATVNLQDDSFGQDPALPGMQAIAAYTLACQGNRSLTVRSIHGLTKGDSYFSASLTILTKIAVRESFSNK